MSEPAPVLVRHNALAHRRRDGAVFIHTEVPKGFEGRGIGAALARAALEHARQSHWRISSRCPFFSSYLARHPEYRDLESAGQRQ